MYIDTEKTIRKYQNESRNKFRQALVPKKFKNRADEALVLELSGMLSATKDDQGLIRKLVRRNKKTDLLKAAGWAFEQPGHNKVKLLALKLSLSRRV